MVVVVVAPDVVTVPAGQVNPPLSTAEVTDVVAAVEFA